MALIIKLKPFNILIAPDKVLLPNLRLPLLCLKVLDEFINVKKISGKLRVFEKKVIDNPYYKALIVSHPYMM